MSDDFATMIVPASLASLARGLAAAMSEGGTGMFTAGLSPSGAEPATHFVSTGYIGERFVPMLTDAAALFAACQQAGSAVSQAQCDALVAQSDVSTSAPFARFAELGLRLVATAE